MWALILTLVKKDGAGVAIHSVTGFDNEETAKEVATMWAKNFDESFFGSAIITKVS